ncbi:hypothetical protein HHL22_18080 [Hymenobacter sp. RP-2-7]|uniref:Uncharacterized protein n=1 Tax=Hymenobacter polaris TaxID=2682546 RepID=A0A7Y0AGW1_9BACT|nr:hypothetical protein [Hymenobacter polaris]NML67117.1 hypothetical protein [Hymenobacter polaris]
MQPAPPAQHRRLARLNAFIERQDRIVYILLIVTAAIGLSWVIWRHQYLIYRDQHPTSVAKPVPSPQAAR